MLFEKDAAGLAQKSYTRGLGFPGGIGGIISMKCFEQEDDGLEENTSYYHYDALGSVRGLSNQKGNLDAEFDYDAFGNELKHKGDAKKNVYRFSSKEFEDHAGLYFFGARYYDPEIGRWLTPDPLGFIDGPNKYLYVANNPLNLVDPYGLLGERLNSFQTGLDLLGIADPTPVSDSINALIYATRGEWGYAGVSILGIIPYLGDVAKGGKYAGKLSQHIQNSMQKRGWTESQIVEAVEKGKKYPAIDKTQGGQPATRYVHPETGKSVVINNTTGEIIHVGGEGFRY